ncbi:MAG: alpha-N-acetylglucosaminidase TIM-barrel domain-containing protein [Planctomycetota bacterium]|nr:alpha-N-acetylglucosaminidase TIM-barrel domain-containing protein [Planctomycetota bacterium]
MCKYGFGVLMIAGVLMSLACQDCEAGVHIVDGGESRAVIMLGEKPTWIERHAADELAGYVKQISGAELKVFKNSLKAAKDSRNIILIGRPETNAEIKKLSGRGLVKVSPEHPGLDGFVIKTISSGDKNYLVLSGSMDRSVLYAVYHLLENFCDVGFFGDGDRIPKKAGIAFGELDLSERPQFAGRENIQACAFHYSMQYWSFADWKREIDWTAKKKFNLIDTSFGGEIIRQKVYAQFGIDTGKPTPWEIHKGNLAKRVIQYAHQLGMETVSPGFRGGVHAKFHEAFPKAKYFEADWLGIKSYTLHPADPLFVKLGVAFLKEYNRTCGSSHIYNFDPYPETSIGSTVQEKNAVMSSFAKSVVKMIKGADEQGKWRCSGWAFAYSKDYWTGKAVKNFLDAIPDDMLIVNDIRAEAQPVHKRLDFFYGKSWGFGVLHSMGGWTSLHGDLADLIKRVNQVADDPKANRCVNYYINPEIIRHNFIYFDLAARLAWNPKSVELDEFINNYSLRRYGEQGAAGMARCWKELAGSVYGKQINRGGDPVIPLYQERIGGAWPYNNPAKPKLREILAKRFPFIISLRNAMDTALKESVRLSDNRFYQTDLVDMLRQYLGERFNYHIVHLYKAFAEGDSRLFEEHAKAICHVMENQIKLLSCHEDYWVETELSKARKLPARASLIPNDQDIRQRYSALLGMKRYPVLADYARKDMYELLRFYYYPRVVTYISHLRYALKDSLEINNQKLDRDYRKICQAWVKDSVGVKPPEHRHESVVEVVKQVFSDTKVQDSDVALGPVTVKMKTPVATRESIDEKFSLVGSGAPTDYKGLPEASKPAGCRLDSKTWGQFVGDGKSYLKLEDDGKGGRRLHLVGDNSCTEIFTKKRYGGSYTIEFDYIQPSDENGRYKAIVRPNEPNTSWYFEWNGQSCSVYTTHKGKWSSPWNFGKLCPDAIHHVRIEKRPGRVSVTIHDEMGGLLGASGWHPYDELAPATIRFQAKGHAGESHGVILDNVKITPQK